MEALEETLEAQGILSTNCRLLAELVAACPSFQERAEVDDAEEALALLWQPHRRRQPGEELSGLIGLVALQSLGFVSRGAGHFRQEGTTLLLQLSDDDRYPGQPDLSQTDFYNFLGQLLGEMAELQGAGDRLVVRAIRTAGPPTFSSPAVAGQGKDYWIALFEIDIGPA